MQDNSYVTPKKSRQRPVVRQASFSGQASTAGTPGLKSRLSERRYTMDSDSSLMAEVSIAESSSPERHQIVSAKELFTDKAAPLALKPRHRRTPTQPEYRGAQLKLHNRSTSHQRKQSICILPGKTFDQVVSELEIPKGRSSLKRTASTSYKKNVSFCSEVEDTTRRSKASSHVRTASDLDSVIYLGPEESVEDQSCIENVSQLSLRDSLEDTSRHIPSLSYEKTTTISEAGPWVRHSTEQAVMLCLPVFGPMPVAAYCPHCKLQVHTLIKFREDPGMTASVWAAITSAFGCCSVPPWLNKLRMHYCASCSSVLAKTG